MLSTAKLTANDPHDVIEITPDIVLAAREDRAPVSERTSLAPGMPAQVAPQGSGLATAASAPQVDATFRASATDRAHSPGQRGRWVVRVTVGFLFALVSAVGAAAWQVYGDDAQQMVANWMPHFALRSAPPAEGAAGTEPSAAPAAPAAAPAQPAAAAPAAEPAASAAAAAPDTTQLLQSMARDLASLGQQVEQMKASMDELKSRQEQMSREIAKGSEPGLRPKVVAPATPPPAARAARAVPPPSVHRPLPPRQAVPYAPAPAAAPSMPPPPDAAPVDAQGEPVVRPPMPLR
jgi:hypothetical protein